MEILARYTAFAYRRCVRASLWRIGLAVLMLSGITAGQQLLEDEVKAAFLLNFTRFVEWPSAAFADESTPITICLLGEGAVGDAVSHLVQGEKASGRAITAKKVKRFALEGCHVLFVANSEKDVAKLLTGVRPGVLTVGETEGFLREGGMIGFVTENRRVRFDISQATAAKALLLINGRLLNVARSVEK